MESDSKDTYFIINGIVYVIVYKDLKREIYKKENDELKSLSLEEKKDIEELLSKDSGYTYNSEELKEVFRNRLSDIVRNKEKFENELYLYKYLEWLEGIIPQSCRDNLYRNVKILRIDYNLDVLNDITKDTEEKINVRRCGGYDAVSNTVDIDKNAILRFKQIAKTTSDPDSYFKKRYSHVFLHELSHMASSKYSEDNKVALCGYDTYPPNDISDINRGLTEGMTELIATLGCPEQCDYESGYFIEESFVYQLSQMIGLDILLESYFSNKGTKVLEQKLTEIGYSKYKVFALFRNIEMNYQLRQDNCKQNLVGCIQSSLLDYLDEKCNAEMKNPNFTRENIEKLFTLYERGLITPEKIQLLHKDPENYDGLLESVSKFYNIKEKYLNIVRTEK